MPFVPHQAPLADGEFCEVTVGEAPVLVARCDGALYGIDAICSHEHVQLRDGILNVCEIICPRHFSGFDVRTGKVTVPPATENLQVYDVTETSGGFDITPL
jgi:3-phenylpropionate/trans-cinnamate dioxygenase ferredoxin subunit